MGRPDKELLVSDRAARVDRSQSFPAALVRRVQMIWGMAEGEPNSVVATHFGVSRPRVTFWRTRFRERGIEGLHNELTLGRPRHTSRLQLHRSRRFKLSNDRLFIEKVFNIVGLYLNPPEHALVLSVNGKSQAPALENSKPILAVVPDPT